MTLTVTIILVLHKLIVIIHVMWIMSTLACFQLLRLHALSFSDILINHYHLFQGQLLCLKISSMLVWVFVGLIQKSIERLIDYELGYCFWSWNLLRLIDLVNLATSSLAERHWQTMLSKAQNWLASAELPSKYLVFCCTLCYGGLLLLPI